METIDREHLHAITAQADEAALECDGCSRLVALYLDRAGVPFEIVAGSVIWVDDSGLPNLLPVHYWVDAGGFTIDYRLRMWTNQSAPHGVFTDTGTAKYIEDHKPPYDRWVSEILEEAIVAERQSTKFFCYLCKSPIRKELNEPVADLGYGRVAHPLCVQGDQSWISSREAKLCAEIADEVEAITGRHVTLMQVSAWLLANGEGKFLDMVHGVIDEMERVSATLDRLGYLLGAGNRKDKSV